MLCLLQNFLRAKFTICLTFSDKGDLITGDSNGTIYVFGDGGNKITNFIKHAHDVSNVMYKTLRSFRVWLGTQVCDSVRFTNVYEIWTLPSDSFTCYLVMRLRFSDFEYTMKQIMFYFQKLFLSDYLTK